jgi:amidase
MCSHDVLSLRKLAASERVFDEEYHRALAHLHELGRERGIDAALKEHHLDALVVPAYATVRPPHMRLN